LPVNSSPKFLHCPRSETPDGNVRGDSRGRAQDGIDSGHRRCPAETGLFIPPYKLQHQNLVIETPVSAFIKTYP
jgi:hypothetical protein